MNKNLEKLFDEEFPKTQKEATHFDGCVCWSCNDYREKVKSHIDKHYIARKDCNASVSVEATIPNFYSKKDVLNMIGKDNVVKVGNEKMSPQQRYGYNQRGAEMREKLK